MHEFSRIAIPIHLPAKKNMLFTVKVLMLLLLPVFYSFIKNVFTVLLQGKLVIPLYLLVPCIHQKIS